MSTNFDITDQSCNSIPCNLNYLLSSFVKDQNQQQNIVLTLKLTLQRRIFRVFLADTVANSIMCVNAKEGLNMQILSLEKEVIFVK